jgi:hypothetical protein
MRSLLFLLVACGATSPGNPGDAAVEEEPENRNFTCVGSWGCSGDNDAGFTSFSLTVQNGECILGMTMPPTVLHLDGAIFRNGQQVGHVKGSGDTVDMQIDTTKYVCRGATASTRACPSQCGM